jgi:hypothetical protein
MTSAAQRKRAAGNGEKLVSLQIVTKGYKALPERQNGPALRWQLHPRVHQLRKTLRVRRTVGFPPWQPVNRTH